MVGEIIPGTHFLVEQEGFGQQGFIVAYAKVEHETHPIEHHLIGKKDTQLIGPTWMDDLAALVDDILKADA